MRKSEVDKALAGDGNAQCNLALTYDGIRGNFIDSKHASASGGAVVESSFRYGRESYSSKIEFWVLTARMHGTNNPRCVNWKGTDVAPGKF